MANGDERLASKIQMSRRVAREIEQLMLSAQSWNDDHPEVTPMDFEGERLALIEARLNLSCLEQGDTIQAAIHGRNVERILREAMDFCRECLSEQTD